ncbi:Dihydrofolate reductase [Catalinimonas alkaloidigena]|uniref:Dihydrofolate reductase n=1 Tax=Catalinimonas alkaloidigena TaxID=1075417 RepID=A0A1G8X553_9BACT|nr:dihydrofolate reductase family protein [Catalinimonas alkaloidigena]SDJ85683.1 Dihydrofolate reductase [Catalinimonas alkaloidigena]
MRKLKLQVQTTIDGFIAGPQGEMDWMVFDWSDDLKDYVTRLTDPIETILLGRTLAEGFIPHWAGVAADPQNPEHAAGKKFTETPKVVFTRTLKASPWERTALAQGDLTEEVNRLKQPPGGDLITYGGSRFASALIKARLIDDLHLFVNPVVLGRGLPIFQEVATQQAYHLANARTFDCGIIVLHYQPKSIAL